MSRFQGNSAYFLRFAETYVEQLKPAIRAAAPFTLAQQYGPDYADRLWPRSRIIGSDPASPVAAAQVFSRVEYWQDVQPKGAGGWGRISGVTRDAAGAVLGGCTVDLFRTSDDLKRDSVVSDAGDGTYSVGADTDATHYAVAYLAGSPDRAGTTVNTLTGS